MKPDKCIECGKPLVPDKKKVIFGTKKWDGHTYKLQCKCLPENIRVCIG